MAGLVNRLYQDTQAFREPPHSISREAEYAGAKELANFYTDGQHSFAGSDVKTLFYIPTNKDAVSLEMKNIQTLTYSIFREKIAVRSLGFIGEKGRTRGMRTIAGSMVFTAFDKHPLLNVMKRKPGDMSYLEPNAKGLGDLEYLLGDQLPPINVVLQFANELGRAAEIVLFGVEFASEGQVMSIHDMITENTMQYTAQYIAVMRPRGYESAYGDYVPDWQEGNGSRTFSSIMNGKNKSDELNDFIYRSSNPFR